MVNSRGNDLDDRVYTLTTYIAAPGTPIIDPATGQRSESFPGHMYYMISDGSEVSGYGFAPIRHTMLGRGEVSPNDFLRYQDPVYARTIEITQDQYDKLKEFGRAGLDGENTYFNLYYNGTSNSCIDFTWGALNHAGLHQQLPFPNGQSMPLRTHDGQLLPESNIAGLQSIPAPFPNSPYNRVETNPAPPGWAEKADRAKDTTLQQWQNNAREAIDTLKCAAFPKLPDCPPDGASLDSRRVLPDPRTPASQDAPLYEQIKTGVTRIDASIGRTFDATSERLAMSTFADAKAAGMTSADHVMLNERGSFLIAVQGTDPYAPAAKRAVTDVAQAVERPVEQSLQRVETLNRQQTLALAQQQNHPTQDGPSHGPRMM
jgi:hypothetical protein